MKIDNMKKDEILRRLNNMCVVKMRVARAMEGYESTGDAEEARKDAFALNRAALSIDVHMK